VEHARRSLCWRKLSGARYSYGGRSRFGDVIGRLEKVNKMISLIHPTAIVDPAAIIGEGTTIGAYSIIGPRVVLGKNNVVGPHVVIEGNTKVGDANKFYQFCSVGSDPQDLKFKGEDSVLQIGNQNLIREYVTLQPGTTGGGMITKIGDKNLFMATSHIGHDSHLGDRCVIANGVAVAGHVTLGNGVILGGLSAIHQFVRIGDLALVGGGAMVDKDIPPFCLAAGDRARISGINKIGLQRSGVTDKEVSAIKSAYMRVFNGTGLFRERLQKALLEVSEEFPLQRTLLHFIRDSKRGIAPVGRRKDDASDE